MKKLTIGFVGSGFIAKFLAVAMEQVRHCKLSAILNRSGSEDLAAYARKKGLGDAKVYDSVTEMCNYCDAIAIFSPNYTRLSIMEEIADAVKKGAPLKGVICEKPLGRTVAEANRMVELADEAELLTAYFENQLHMNAINNALHQLRPQQKAMGHFTLARSTEELPCKAAEFFPTWDATV